MTATAHTLISLSIAKFFSHSIISLPLILLAHFFCDLIPHWDIGTNHKTKSKNFMLIQGLLDLALGFFLGVFLFLKNPLNNLGSVYYYLFITFLAQSIDWFDLPYFFWGWNFPPFSWAYNFQHRFHRKSQLPNGLITQIAIVIPIVYWSLKT